MKKITKRIFAFLIPSLCIYFAVSVVLICWPIPEKKNIENYDYSSLSESTQEIELGQETSITLRDGFNLFSRVYESNSEYTLLLLHGSGSESRYLSGLASYLSKSGLYRVITPDLRGHGRNAGIRGDINYLGQLDHDIEDILLYLNKKYDNTKIVLGGHSSGGGMALRYMGSDTGTHPDGLVLFAPYLGHESPTVKPNSGEWVTVALKRWIGLSMLNNVGVTFFNDLPVLIFNRPEDWNDNLQVASYSYRMAVNFAPNNYIEDIKSIDIPTLVLVGEKDEGFYPQEFDSVFDSSRPHSVTHIVKNANHMNIIDSKKSIEHLLNWHKDSLKPKPQVSINKGSIVE